MHYQEQTIPDRLSELRAFGDWLGKRGIDYRRTRLGSHVRFFEELIGTSVGQQLSHDQLDLMLYMLREADELLWIFRGLRTNQPPGYLDIVREALGGSPFAKDDGVNRRARDLQLELRIASYFLQTGFSVDLSQQADLVVELETGVLFVECKRLESPRQVRRRLREAAAQLRRCHKPTRDSFSLDRVALDSGKARALV